MRSPSVRPLSLTEHTLYCRERESERDTYVISFSVISTGHKLPQMRANTKHERHCSALRAFCQHKWTTYRCSNNIFHFRRHRTDDLYFGGGQRRSARTHTRFRFVFFECVCVCLRVQFSRRKIMIWCLKSCRSVRSVRHARTNRLHAFT